MNCPDIDELERFATEALTPEAAAGLASHLRECPLCADRLVEIKANLTAAAPISGVLRDTGLLDELGPASRFIEGFRILREIGRGGSGVVFEAEQATPRRAVALKLLRRTPGDHDARTFRREVAALARLEHPGIAALHAAVERGRHDLTLREALDGAARRLDEGALSGRPAIEAPVRNAIGNAYRALGLLDEAERHMTTALDIARRELPPLHEQRMSILNDLGLLCKDRADFAGAERYLRQAADARHAAHGPDDRRTGKARANHAAALVDLGELDRARDAMDGALRSARLHETDDPENLAACLNTLGKLEHRRGNLDAAETHLRESLQRLHALHGDEHPAVPVVSMNLAAVLRDKGDSKAAYALYLQALDLPHPPPRPRPPRHIRRRRRPQLAGRATTRRAGASPRHAR